MTCPQVIDRCRTLHVCVVCPHATSLRGLLIALVPQGMMQVDFSSMTPTAFISAMTKSGGSKADCGTFARTVVSDITTTVSTQQDVFEALDNRDGCAALGQTLVTSTQTAVVAAQAGLVTKQGLASAALAAQTTACTASVEFAVNVDNLPNS